MANPAAAVRWWRFPADGIGLALMEFIIGNLIKIHPMAFLTFGELKDAAARRKIAELTRGFKDKAHTSSIGLHSESRGLPRRVIPTRSLFG